MKEKMNIGLIALVILSALFLAGCDDAQVASHNLVKAADNFEVNTTCDVLEREFKKQIQEEK